VETKAFDRIEALLAAADERSQLLHNDVQLLRLMMLRHLDRMEEADRLEAELVAACRAEPLSPVSLDEQLQRDGIMDQWNVRYPRSYMTYNPRGWTEYYSQWASPGRLGTVPQVAQALGVRFAADVRDSDLTLPRIRDAYARHGFPARAAGIDDLWLSRVGASLSARRRADAEKHAAAWLRESGQMEAARRRSEKLIAFWKQEADRCPDDPVPYDALASLYASKAYGQAYEAAYEALLAAKRIDPGVDPDATREARLLYEMGRYDEAWRLYSRAIRTASITAQNATLWYRIGIAAGNAGEQDAAARFARLALWCDPQHAMAKTTQELIHD
jgi:tetratricopeptide (TPR) repeat protein